ncbi:MAG: DUF1566 domain-containing protein [Candidatus Aureabacteria bacterium]|nr:DUF1566 domain-containing protein [Candidatus Auribacterota bacterium]
MRATLVVVVSVMIAASLCGTVVAGSLDSPGAPSAGSGMYTLSQIYDYMNSGIKATPVPNFQEPSVAPGSTMKTTKEIYDDIVAKLDQCPATAANVESGIKFFCTQPGSWGIQTGTGVMQPTPTPTITSTPTITPTPTPWGYPDVLRIGNVYVASNKDGNGCAADGRKGWAAAGSWADGLDWLGKTDWRLPTIVELNSICAVKDTASGFTYQMGSYWSSIDNGSDADDIYFANCIKYTNIKSEDLCVRAVRGVE